MPRYFTHYWANETAEKAQALGEDKLEWVASNGFVWRGVSAGDVVYPVTVVEGVLRLLGSLEVGIVCDLEAAREELGYDPWWEASDYLLAAVPLPTRFDLAVPTETTRSLRFVGEGGSQPPVFVAPGRLDRQTMRGIRELTPASAAALEALLLPAGPRRLRPYEDYSREEVHDIFAPDTPFAPQRGAWGCTGSWRYLAARATMYSSSP